MTVNSMTGHGRGEASFKGAKIIVELNSVNHRQFDLRLDLPPYLSFIEMDIRRIIHASLSRGSVSCRFFVVPGAQLSTQQIIIDQCLARQCLQIASQIARKHKTADDFGISALFSIPGVIKILPASRNNAKLKHLAVSACRQALKQLCAMRAIEGCALEREIRCRIQCLDTSLNKIEHRRPIVARQYKSKIKDLLVSAAENAGDKKILRDIVMLAERGDIAEELERSRSHLKQFNQLLTSRAPVGRTMDFLVQEMMREINTIGAKSNDCLISNLVVKYKSELECIREQVQNIE